MISKRALVIVVDLAFPLLMLSACTTGYDQAVHNAEATADHATAVCGALLKAGSTSFAYWKCGDDAMLAAERVIDNGDMDIYEAEAARNELIAAEVDAGKLTHQEASAFFDASQAETQHQLKVRLEAIKNRDQQITCTTLGNVTTCN